jgi:hypothetical protein
MNRLRSEKASAKNVLDKKFTEFEKEMAGLGDHLKK